MQFKNQGSYTSPKLEAREIPGKGGYGVFALAPIAPEELLILWAGEVVTLEELNQRPPEVGHHGIQIEEGLYLVPRAPGDPADYVNHSCAPNAGLRGQVGLVALRPIVVGEEICFDYAMSDGSPYDEFECGCGAAACRGIISGNDWQKPALWEKYAGHFSPYLQRRIEAFRAKRVA